MARRCLTPSVITNSKRSGEATSDSVSAGDRGWVKIKNREYWRYEVEREGAITAARSAGVRSSDPRQR
jgi:hypothetical protein